MFKSAKSKVIALGASAVVLATNAAAAVTLPTTASIDYTSVELAVGLLVAILVTVYLLKKLVSFFR